MAPVAVMLNLRADALTAAYSGDNQRGRPTTGSKAAHCLSPTGATAVQLTQPAPIVISEMEQAALNRMAKSIAQLTLCQVTGEEIATATKLLEKACQKLRGIPEVPPQRITDLDNATRQLHQLSCILDSCTISASYEVSQAVKSFLCLTDFIFFPFFFDGKKYEVSQAQKALLLLPRTEKGSSTSSEEHYANLPDPTHEDVLQEH